VGAGPIVVALNKAAAADPEIAGPAEPEVRELLSGQGYPADRTPAIRVPALREGPAGLTELRLLGRSLSETQKGGQ
jgi:translation elongation factor EF-Tu-like GTPase